MAVAADDEKTVEVMIDCCRCLQDGLLCSACDDVAVAVVVECDKAEVAFVSEDPDRARKASRLAINQSLLYL